MNSQSHETIIGLMEECIKQDLRWLRRPAIFPDLYGIPGFKGCEGIGIPEKNICYWPGLSLEASLAMLSLIDQGVVSLLPASPERYLNAGFSVSLPLAEKIRNYMQPMWFPVMICLSDEWK